MKQAGKAISHESARGHVTGAAKYVDDLWPAQGEVAHLWPVMSPHARARVLSVDAQAALALPGVLAVLTAADVPGENDVGPARRDEPLFPSEVQHHAQAVAWVAGASEEQARAEFSAGNPQGRIVQTEEVADAVRWLCGAAASSITGQAISVSGGEVM